MSDQFNSDNSPIKKELVDQIERLNLSTLQKLHLKLLTHCLEVFKEISSHEDMKFPKERQLYEWCQNEANKLNDETFSALLYEQMNSAATKLKDYSQKIGKYPLDLDLDDLVNMTSSEN